MSTVPVNAGGLTIAPVSLSAYPTTYRGYTEIAPFTYRSAATYQDVLESIRTWIPQQLIPNLTANFAATDDAYTELLVRVQAIVDQLSTEISSAIAARALLDEGFTPVVNVLAHGAVGDGVADDTAAVQAAITAALAASDPVDVQTPRGNGQPVTVFFPKGTYSVNELHVPGTVRFAGEGGYAYASATLLQRAAGHSIVILEADTDGTSNASSFDSLTFRSAVATSDVNVAQVRAVPGINTNSIYFRHCWFATPERQAVWIPQGDDIKFEHCTFDVSAFHAIKLGDTASQVTNAAITDCTFYNIAVNTIDAVNVRGLAVNGNRAYHDDSATGSMFLKVSNGETVAVTGNTVRGYARVAALFSGQGFTVTGNTIDGVTDVPFYVGGGQILYALVITGNTVLSPAALAHGALWVDGSGVQVSVFGKNAILAGAASPLLIDASDARVTGNDFAGNSVLRFTTSNNLASPAANGL